MGTTSVLPTFVLPPCLSRRTFNREPGLTLRERAMSTPMCPLLYAAIMGIIEPPAPHPLFIFIWELYEHSTEHHALQNFVQWIHNSLLETRYFHAGPQIPFSARSHGVYASAFVRVGEAYYLA